ncbi:MAG: glycoside hydrolase family 2 protein [Bacilli bacterium]|nr:glycoside hydrolase family 2 protein [Bacilli bacterium]
MRKLFPLNFDWRFTTDFKDEFLKSDFSISKFAEVMLPHQMVELPANHLQASSYQIVGTYFRDLTIDALPEGQRAILRFYGVMNTCKVYLNSEFIGEHKGGYTPFAYDITDKLHQSGENRLVVMVEGFETPNIPPFGGVVDYLGYSGIYREVELEIVPEIRIQKVFVRTDVAPSLMESEMILRPTALFSKNPGTEAQIVFRVFKGEKQIQIEEFTLVEEREQIFSFLVQDIERWELDNPSLYTLQTELSISGSVIDQVTTRFGFRTCEFTTEGFLLNNRKVKLIGLNRHQSYPYVGYAMPKRMQESDANVLKYELGCNIVRTSHYMQSDHFINRCDEIGLLVFEEIPGWQYIGDENFKELTLANLEVMITHHFNHPSIILWGVRINESPDDHEFYEKTNRLAHQLDDTRQTGGVRNFRKSEFLEDVYTYNDFSHHGDNPGLEHPNKIAGRLVPYLVTEHNGHVFPTKKNDSEEKKIEHAYRHLNVIDSAFASDRFSGAIGWCLADYGTHQQFGANDRVCYHGVTDMFRIPKYASYPYMSLRTDGPILKVASSMTPGAFVNSVLPPTFVYTNCDYVKIYLNDELLGKHYPDWPTFPDIPNAPVIIDDYIGDRILVSGEYKPRVAKSIKTVLNAFTRYGFAMPFKLKLRMLSLMMFNKMTMKTAMDIYGKYVGNWGSPEVSFRIEGYIDDKLVKSVVISQPKSAILKLYPDATQLRHELTYDVVRVVIQMEDENNNLLGLANDVVSVKPDGSLSVIGPSNIALVGGSTAIYLKTTGKLGKSVVELRCPNQPTAKLEFDIN